MKPIMVVIGLVMVMSGCAGINDIKSSFSGLTSAVTVDRYDYRIGKEQWQIRSIKLCINPMMKALNTTKYNKQCDKGDTPNLLSLTCTTDLWTADKVKTLIARMTMQKKKKGKRSRGDIISNLQKEYESYQGKNAIMNSCLANTKATKFLYDDFPSHCDKHKKPSKVFTCWLADLNEAVYQDQNGYKAIEADAKSGRAKQGFVQNLKEVSL